MDNKHIIALLKDTATLLELHGANPFQIKHYSNAALCLEKIPQAVAAQPLSALKNLTGATASAAKLIHEINTTGTLRRWEELNQQTPQGLWELLRLQGLGPKKVRQLWQGLGIDNAEDLLQACEQGQIASLPGFGQKTQATILASLAFQAQNKHKVHYATALPHATALLELIQQRFPTALASLTGPMRRKMETIDQVDILVGTDQRVPIVQWLNTQPQLKPAPQLSGPFAWRGTWIAPSLRLNILFCPPKAFYQQLLLHTGAAAHLSLNVHEDQSLGTLVAQLPALESEEAAYAQVRLPFIPPELREGHAELAWARDRDAPPLLTLQDLKGVFHCHTTASDGKNTLEEMAQQCRKLGYAYLGISDHSQSATYAGGLRVAEIYQQHQAIDNLNQSFTDFRVFKGIESDILADGNLDYPDEVLALFDFVVASVHTGLQMDAPKATERLLKAIANPYTTMLGHPTGRLLLRRQGFPVDYKAIIDACAAHNVIIEINANPWRLDLDWRWIDYALSQKVWLSINPDAHDTAGIEHVYYGVCVGRKGGLTAAQTFNALPLPEVTQYLAARKA